MFKAREAQRRFVNTVRVPSCTRKERALVRERHRTSGGTSPKTLADEFGISTTAISNYIRNASNDNVGWDQEYLDGSRPDFFGLDYGVKEYVNLKAENLQEDAGLSASSATAKISSSNDVPEKSNTTKRVPSQVGVEAVVASDASSSGTPSESQDSTSSTPSNDPDPSASSDSNIPPAISRKRPRSPSAASLHIPPAIFRKKPHLDAWEPKMDVQNTADSGQVTLSAVETSTSTVVPATSTSKSITAPVGPVTRRITGRRGPLVIKSRAAPHPPAHKLKAAQSNATSNGAASLQTKGKEVPTKSILTNKDSGHPSVDGFLRSLNKLHVKAHFDKCGIRTHQDLLEVSRQISDTPQNREDFRKTFLEQGMSITDWFTIVAGVQKYADSFN
ncbi:hypothetical protein ARMSODRAFT_1082804 [Armillaria solidipes]|uniref:Uncharacterized protein n=1 Tax=Armillaria solidipes TaxID=1076256 RepID=A0A2H3CAR7_9AGAR|nr:hypothetical protein ARMSODRAFT_1082804 [Armillaria solidipes]